MAKEAKTTKTTPKKTTKKATTKKTSTTTKVKKSTPKSVATTKQTKIIQEENNYKNTIIAAIIIALIFIVGIFAINKLSDNQEETYTPTEDEVAFKEDYESLNGSSDTQVKIIKDNNIEYINMNKAAEILDSGSGIIFFGYANDEFSRAAVPVLLKSMSSSKLETIYYVNIRPENKEENDLRDLYSLNSKNKAKIAKAATEEYNLVRTALANHLNDYVLTTSKGKEVNTGQKRLNTPTVVSVVEGQVLGFHEGTVEGHRINKDNKLPGLTKEQEKLLLEEYTQVISSQLNKKCTIEEGC